MIYGNFGLIALAAAREDASLRVRMPRDDDGPSVWRLIGSAPSLDKNSLYCNLLQCTHFAPTCAIAELDGEVAGWLSGYVPPGRDDTLFVWQVCVGAEARGRGLAKALIADVLGRDASASIRYVACTITDDNAASWALFGSIARALDAPLQRFVFFTRDTHFDGTHESETLVTIGPFERDRTAALTP